MNIVFYSIDNKQYKILESKVNNYNKIIREIFSNSSSNRIKLIKEKSQIEKEIIDNINECVLRIINIKERYKISNSVYFDNLEFDNINYDIKKFNDII